MRCAVCHFQNPAGQNYCGGCAADLKQQHRCFACDAANPIDFRYCGNCGEPLFGIAQQREKGSEHRHLTVMFCDLTESTALAESLDIEDYRDLVNTYFAAVHEIIAANNGYIAQDLGDGVLVYFGFPIAREDDALRAVRSGLGIVGGISRLSESTRQRYGVGAQVRVGIHTGSVITGDVGSEKRLEQLAVGITVNIAARVQHEAGPGEVWLTSDTYELVRRDVTAESLGPKRFKGVLDAIDVYCATSIRPARVARDGVVTPPFVGRNKEIETLLALHRSVIEGCGKLVLIKGDPGIGKSRLVTEFQQRTSAESQWITCRCSVYEQDSDLYPIVSALRRQMGISNESSVEDRQTALATWMASGNLTTAEDGEILKPLFALGHPQPDSGGMLYVRRQRFELLRRWLQSRAAASASVILVIEDVHWADPSTLELVGLLASSLDGTRVLLLLTTRSGFRLGWEPNADLHAFIDVGRLSDDDAKTLMREWNFNSLPADISDELVSRADGVPLYLEELTRAMVTTQSNLKTAANLERFIPDSLRDLLMARIDALGDAKEITQIGALLGRSFDREMLQAVTGIDRDRLDGLLYRVLDAGILVSVGEDGSRFRFRHSLILDAAYDSLLKSRRIELHSRVVTAIRQRFPRLRETEPGVLARHHEGACQTREAAEAYMLAATQASDRGANDESIRIYDRGLEIIARLPEGGERAELEYALLTKKCDPLRAKYGYANERIRPILERLEHLRPVINNPNRFNELFAKWGYHCMAGNRDLTEQVANELRTFAVSSDKSIHKAVASFAAGSTAFYQGRFSDALPELRACIEIADKRGFGTRARDVDGSNPIFLAHLVISWCLSLSGHLDDAAGMLEKIERLSAEHEGKFGGTELPRRGFEFGAVQLKTWKMFCNEDTWQDREHALRLAESIERIAKEYDFERWIRVARGFRLRSLLWTTASDDGTWRDLFDALESTISIDEVTAGYELTRMADVLLQFGKLGPAQRALVRASDLSKENLGRLHASEAERLQGVLCLREGRRDAGIQHFHAAIHGARTLGGKIQELRAHVTLATELPEAAREMTSRFRDVYGAITGGAATPLLRQAGALLS